jgi:hypothetical protein
MCSEFQCRGSTSNHAEAGFQRSRWAAIGAIDDPRSTPGLTVSKSVRRAFAKMSESACRTAEPRRCRSWHATGDRGGLADDHQPLADAHLHTFHIELGQVSRVR